MTQKFFVRRLSPTLVRWFCKTCLFAAIAAVVLNPNLRIALRQIQHTFRPESLIQSDFTGLSELNRELDEMARKTPSRFTEPKLIERYVLKKIRYVTDYENWDNIEYWPTASEVWSKHQEDCDGRAILAASILRSRGFPSAKLVVGLKHMWVQVDENEKDPSKPSHVIALLNPERGVQLAMKGNPHADHFLQLAKGFLQPTALRETSADLIADIPPIRKAILVVVLLAFCYHPRKSRRGLLPVMLTGLASAYLLADWSVARTSDLELGAGLILFSFSVAGALLMNRLGGREKSQPKTEPVALAVMGETGQGQAG